MLPKEMDDFIQLFMVAVTVHKNFKLRVASFGFSGLNVYKIDMVFLHKKKEEKGFLSFHIVLNDLYDQ